MNVKTKYSLRIIVILIAAVFIVRGVFVNRILNHVETMVKTYLSFIEKEFPGDTYSSDARFITYYILPQNKMNLIIDLRKWSLDSFVKDGDQKWYDTVKKVYDVETWKAGINYYKQENKAAETFDTRQKKWRSSGVRPYLNEERKKVKEVEKIKMDKNADQAYKTAMDYLTNDVILPSEITSYKITFGPKLEYYFVYWDDPLSCDVYMISFKATTTVGKGVLSLDTTTEEKIYTFYMVKDESTSVDNVWNVLKYERESIK